MTGSLEEPVTLPGTVLDLIGGLSGLMRYETRWSRYNATHAEHSGIGWVVAGSLRVARAADCPVILFWTDDLPPKVFIGQAADAELTDKIRGLCETYRVNCTKLGEFPEGWTIQFGAVSKNPAQPASRRNGHSSG